MATEKVEVTVSKKPAAKKEPAAKTAETKPAASVTDSKDWWPHFRKTSYVQAWELEEKLREGDLVGNAGDYIVYGSLGDTWVVGREEFHATYKPLTPNKA